jgi:hypothetical protein
MPVNKAADELGVAASTLFRWLQAGFIRGEQDTPGAPWRIRVNDQLRALFVDDAPAGYVPIVDAMRILGVSRQTVLQRVKRGELQALHVRNGRQKGLRILVPQAETSLFDGTPMNGVFPARRQQRGAPGSRPVRHPDHRRDGPAFSPMQGHANRCRRTDRRTWLFRKQGSTHHGVRPRNARTRGQRAASVRQPAASMPGLSDD